MEYLYVLVRKDEIAFKVGITNNIENRLSSIKNEFGEIDYCKSSIFSCESRKLIEQIEGGLHALMNKFYYSPETLGGGSNEWFEINAYEKCIYYVHIFLSEIPEFNLEGILSTVINQASDYNSQLSKIHESMEFMKAHQEMMSKLDVYLLKYKDSIEFVKEKGKYILLSENLSDLDIIHLPDFQWVKKKDNKLIFDIYVYNSWKKSGQQIQMRKLIEIKFFSEFTLKNLNLMYK